MKGKQWHLFDVLYIRRNWHWMRFRMIFSLGNQHWHDIFIQIFMFFHDFTVSTELKKISIFRRNSEPNVN